MGTVAASSSRLTMNAPVPFSPGCLALTASRFPRYFAIGATAGGRPSGPGSRRMKTIGDIVRGRELYSVRPESSVLEAADLMHSKNVGAVPVLEKNRLVGILSERDVLRRVVVRKLTPEDVPVSDVMTRDLVVA